MARIGYVEARAALAAARRTGRLTARQLVDGKAAIDDLWDQLSIIEITEGLVLRAGELAETQRLRGYDSIHLAAAELVAAGVVASSDADLGRAALALGFHLAAAR